MIDRSACTTDSDAGCEHTPFSSHMEPPDTEECVGATVAHLECATWFGGEAAAVARGASRGDSTAAAALGSRSGGRESHRERGAGAHGGRWLDPVCQRATSEESPPSRPPWPRRSLCGTAPPPYRPTHLMYVTVRFIDDCHKWALCLPLSTLQMLLYLGTYITAARRGVLSW